MPTYSQPNNQLFLSRTSPIKSFVVERFIASGRVSETSANAINRSTTKDFTAFERKIL
jgi:hypothetical protein